MSITKKDIIEQLLKVQKSKENLADFCRQVMKIEPARHHQIICDHIDRLLDDEYDELIINTPPGAAKALALDTPIPTPTGWTTMGELRIGDKVFDENGEPCSVTWVSPVHRNRPVYEVTTDSGDSIIADRDHEWLVRLCGKPKKSLKGVDRWGNKTDSTKSREPSFKIKTSEELHRRRAKRPMITHCKALNLPDVELPIDPYLLGVWLGDGTSSTMSITSSDKDRPWLMSELSRLGYEVNKVKAKYLFRVRGVRHLFTAFGLIHDPEHKTYGRKHIPDVYMRASYTQRLHLLQGLIDSDGTVDKRKGSTSFCNTNLELALQVRELVISLGVKAGWTESVGKLNGVEHKMAYGVEFYLGGSARLPRKWVYTRNQYRTPNHYIDVIPIGIADTVCIEVDSPSHLFLCGRSMIPTHNSTYTSIALPSYFLGKNPRGQVLGVSYSTELAEKWGRKVRNTIMESAYQKVFEIGLSQDSKSAGRWATDKGGEYYAAGAGSGILGFRADIVICDDPISGFEEAQSKTRLEKLQGWYETDLVTRMKPNAKLVLICQRLARNDLAGYLIDRNKLNPTRRQKLLILPMEATEDLDIVGRMVGDRLWPEWFTEEMVEDAKRDDYKWRTLYQQQPPSDEGSWVSPVELQFIDSAPPIHDLKIYLLTDLALSVNTGDYTVHIVVGVDSSMNIYIIDAWRGRVSPEVTVDKHLSLIRTYSPAESLIDDDNAAKVYVQLLAQAARESGTPVPWKVLPMRGQNKETRAAPLRGWFKRKKMFIVKANWNEWLRTELLVFPNALGSGVDDGVDALSLIGRRLASIATPASDLPPPTPQKTVQQMTLNELFEDREHKSGRSKRI